MHQIWLGQNKIPNYFLIWREHWRQLHPDWEYRLWTEAMIKDDKVLNLINRTLTFSSKSNVLRFYIILQYGGVYSDVDFDWNKNIDEFLIHKAFVCKQTPKLYNAAIFGAEEQNEWISFTFNLMEKYIHKKPPWGAKLVTTSMKNFHESVTTLSTKYFYPYLWNEPYKDAKLFPQSYAVHHWDMSWRREYQLS